MKILFYISIVFYLSILSSCATTSIILLDESTNYPPTNSVQILMSAPKVPYKVIAHLETKGTAGQSLPELLENMREEAKTIGADAILPTEEGNEKVQQGIIYNPWLGGYQTIGGGNRPILRGYAIVYSKENELNQKYPSYNKRNYSFGVGVNFAPLLFNGYGGNLWFGLNRYRFDFEYFKFEIPGSFFRDGFENGKIDKAIRFGADYFFQKRLSGAYFPVAFESWKLSVGREYSTARAEYEMMFFSAGIGYILKISDNLYFDSRFSFGASLNDPGEINVGGYNMAPDNVSYSAFFGLGAEF